MHRSLLLLALPLAIGAYACAAGNDGAPAGAATGGAGAAGAAGGSGGAGGGAGGGAQDDAGVSFDASGDSGFDPDAACATALEEAPTQQLPVDIIWMVDNSVSMAPAIAEVTAGLNAFAALIAGQQLDYKVIMLSLRSKTSPVVVGGSNRYPVCIPPPLAGNADCGNGPRFFHSSIDIRSTQPLEQFLGTLGQTAGYTLGEARGGEPWQAELRPAATKTLVVVTDDNARLSATDFENFPGGQNPFNSLTLPPGILHPSWGGLFDGYLFSGIYGWGSNQDPGVTCQFADGSSPPSPGPTYTTLVNSTGGVRARLCDGGAAWGPFFDAVAQAVEQTSQLSCEVAIPTPSDGTLDPALVNVRIKSSNVEITLVKVSGASDCGPGGGWYYDDPAAPTKVMLCPASCDAARDEVGPGKDGRIEVLFGCETVVQ
ncbi:MAG TPA: hypothetical protein VLS89_11755 [Candidatus Nanopelagicales bacterium]|nr:hypothetical protein [Candidatus Nanopelagicales bacterium]